MSADTLFTAEDEKRVSAAINAAEQGTAGEIVAVVTRSSSNPGYFALLWAAMVALLVPWPLIYFTWWTMQWVFGLQIIVFLALVALLNSDPCKRWVVPASVAKRWAHQRAVEQFLAQNMHTTASRTGVLIFVSVAERYAEVLADTQIDAKVPRGNVGQADRGLDQPDRTGPGRRWLHRRDLGRGQASGDAFSARCPQSQRIAEPLDRAAVRRHNSRKCEVRMNMGAAA